MRLAQLEVDAGVDPDALVLEEILAEIAHPEVGRHVGGGYLPVLVNGIARLVRLVVARREKDARLLIQRRRTIDLGQRGAPLRSMTATSGSPMIRAASSPGLAMVAEQQMKTGSEP